MLSVMTLGLLLAGTQPASTGDQVSMPRHLDPEKTAERASSDDQPTDPWFDRERVATDDPAFILSAVESARQGVIDARDAATRLDSPELRTAAEKIRTQNEGTMRRLENLAGGKGWRLPESNPGRASTVPDAKPARANANFIVHQIAYHQNTVAQYRAQISGKGDKDLKRTLREALPGYEKNLELLLTLKP
jgi:predicted outer membrane protein